MVHNNGLGQGALQARCLHDLENVWEAIVQELGAGSAKGGCGNVEAVSKTLKLVYRLRGGGKGGVGKLKKRLSGSGEGIIDTIEFQYEDTYLENHLCDILDFWHDRRPPRGVAIEDLGRCK